MITRTNLGFYLLCLLLCLSQAAFSQNLRIDSLKQALANTNNPEVAYKLYRELTSAFINVNNLESRRYAERTLAFSRVANEPLNLAYDYYKLGATYFYLGNSDTALLYADSVDWVLTNYPVDSVELRNSIMQAACYRAKGDFTEAVKRNMKALGLARKINRQDSEAAILNNLGNIFVSIEQIRKGLTHFQLAAKYYQKEGKNIILSRVYENIGDAYFLLGQYDSTRYYLRQSLRLNDNVRPATLAYFLMGKMYDQTAQADSSWKYLKLALANAQRHKQGKMEVLALNRIGLQQGHEGRFAEGRANLALASKKSRKLGLAFQIAQNIWNQSELEAQAGNHEQALAHLREFYVLKDSLLNQEMNAKVAYFEEKFNAEQRELEMMRLAKAKAENEALLNQQKYMRAVSISVLLLAVLLGAFILVVYFRTLKSKRLLATKNVRLEELNVEAIDARISAEAANRAKSAFLANMTHEIRTPINGVIGVTDILQYTTLSDEQNVYVQAIRRSGENLLRIVNEVLDFSKIEAGKMELEEAAFNLFDLMDEVMVLFSSQRSDKDLDLACLIDPQLPQTLKGDPHKLRQVLINLIGNAMKFTSEGGVMINIRRLNEVENPERICLQVEVEDTGIGITEEQGRRLFQAFNQADAGIAKKFGGTGLGLTISAKLVELMGGKLEFESEYGQGSRFFFQFDLERGISDSKEKAAKVLLPPAAAKYWENKSALIIEKGRWTRKLLSSHLALAGITPRFASDYSAVEEIISQDSVALVLYAIDQNEDPSKNLFGFIIDKLTALNIPVVLMGSMAKIASQREFFPEVDAFLTKPLQHADFFRLLRSLAAGQNIPLAVPVKTSLSNSDELERSLEMSVLLAEDNDVNRMIALRMFSNLGLEPDFATNGLEALAMCEETEYDMIFMDVNMPEMDGLETTQRLRQKYAVGKRPIIIALTANAMAEDRKRCLQAGMDDYISKPFRIDEVKETFLKYGLVKKEMWRD
ncbi:MAG: response regulator [Bacteroidota bacterium]